MDKTMTPEHYLVELEKIILGKRVQLTLALSCLVAGGHLLIEDIPGTGKTTLAHALAKSFGLSFNRVQFTSDLLPSDVLGGPTLASNGQGIELRKGPIFTQVFLADELNRAPPKTQGALLEAMEERQVSLEGQTLALPEPFFVVATQNPQDLAGTYPLPESQLDRFMVRIELGYPTAQAEREILLGLSRRDQAMQAMADAVRLAQWRQAAEAVHIEAAVIDYIQRLIDSTRELAQIGLSPRAGQSLVKVARSYAFVAGRDYLLPDDVQAVFVAAAAHRLKTDGDAQALALRCLEATSVL